MTKWLERIEKKKKKKNYPSKREHYRPKSRFFLFMIEIETNVQKHSKESITKVKGRVNQIELFHIMRSLTPQYMHENVHTLLIFSSPFSLCSFLTFPL